MPKKITKPYGERVKRKICHIEGVAKLEKGSLLDLFRRESKSIKI